MSTSTTTYPSGISAPLTTDNAENHSGLIVVITAFYLVLVLASVAARISSLYQRKIVQHHDYWFGGLVVVAIAQAAVVLAEVHYGWGTQAESLTVENKDRMLKVDKCKAVYAADILSVVVLGFSKIATCIFYQVLFSQTNRQVIRAILVGICVWTLLSVLLLAIRCGPDPWSDISAKCRALFPMWQVITAVDIITEILLMLYSGLAIYTVRISAKEKLIVFLALECRIILVALAACHLFYVKKQLDAHYPTLIGAYATTTTEIYLSLSVICLVASSLKSFIAVYEDNSGTSYASRSQFTSTSMPKVPTSDNYNSAATVDRSRGWERMEEEDTISNGRNGSSRNRGLQIVKTVHLSVLNESIELGERRKHPQTQKLEYGGRDDSRLGNLHLQSPTRKKPSALSFDKEISPATFENPFSLDDDHPSPRPFTPTSPMSRELGNILYPATKNEQMVNTALIVFLYTLTIHFPLSSNWTLHQRAFTADFEIAQFEARTDESG